jgi:glycosyltransferase involved in cell wall biosynthesis
MKHHPLVSICIPTYNGAQFLQESLESIKKQSYRPIELVVSDDESCDDTLLIISRFRESVDFPVYIHHHEPRGIGANWNNCVKHSNGEYVKFVFQDDLIHDECVEKMVKALESSDRLGLISCKRNFIVDKNSNMKFIEKWLSTYENLQVEYENDHGNHILFTKALFKSNKFNQSPINNKIGEPSLVMFRRSVYEQLGTFRTDLKQALDYEYWYRILKRYDILVLNETLATFRLHLNQATNVNRESGTNDRELYQNLLYNEYYMLLNSAHKKRLRERFHPFFIFKKKIQKKIISLFK